MSKSPSSSFQIVDSPAGITCFIDLPADLETPVSAYLKLSQKSSRAFLFESVDQVEKWGRYSFIGADPEESIWGRGHEVFIERGRKIESFTVENPLDFLKEKLAKESLPNASFSSPFQGGYVGYFGYDCVRFVEDLPKRHAERREVPEWAFMKITTFVIYDNLLQTMRLVSRVPFDGEKHKAPGRLALKTARARLTALMNALSKPLKAELRPLKRPRRVSAFSPESTPQSYMKRVDRAKAYIRAGDVFQVVLSMEFQAKGVYDPVSLYRVLRTVNPSPYLYLLKWDAFSIVGSSPEIMVRKNGSHAVVRPIAGTRRRGKTIDEDDRLEAELRGDPKENAEHVMLVDLGRNDIGRVARPGTVKVSDYGMVERYSHVMHLVSQVDGTLKEGVDAFDLFKATFPAGTLSGAPKVRAMEIIEELEDSRRGVYGGAVGYIGFDGNMDMAIAIRTLVVHSNKLILRAGAGIVQDSVPKLEYEECVNKARALMKVCEKLKAKHG